MSARAPCRDINRKNKTTKISFVVIARGYRTASEAAVSGYFFFVVFLAFFAGAFFFAGMICSPPFTILTSGGESAFFNLFHALIER
jgi:hypothetical protein